MPVPPIKRQEPPPHPSPSTGRGNFPPLTGGLEGGLAGTMDLNHRIRGTYENLAGAANEKLGS